MSGNHNLLLGASGGGAVVLNNKTVSNPTGTNPISGYRVAADGYIYTRKDSTYTQDQVWTTGPTSNYEVRATLLSGSLASGGGTTGTWLNCSTNRDWFIQDNVVDDSSVSAILTMQIRSAVTLEVLASAQITLVAGKVNL